MTYSSDHLWFRWSPRKLPPCATVTKWLLTHAESEGLAVAIQVTRSTEAVVRRTAD